MKFFCTVSAILLAGAAAKSLREVFKNGLAQHTGASGGSCIGSTKACEPINTQKNPKAKTFSWEGCKDNKFCECAAAGCTKPGTEDKALNGNECCAVFTADLCCHIGKSDGKAKCFRARMSGGKKSKGSPEEDKQPAVTDQDELQKVCEAVTAANKVDAAWFNQQYSGKTPAYHMSHFDSKMCVGPNAHAFKKGSGIMFGNCVTDGGYDATLQGQPEADQN